MADTFRGGIDVNDPIRLSGDCNGTTAPSSEATYPKSGESTRQVPDDYRGLDDSAFREAIQKWLSGEWQLFEVTYELPDNPVPQKTEVISGSIRDVVNGARWSESGPSLVSIALIDDLKAAGLVPKDPIKQQALYLAYQLRRLLPEIAIRIQSAYSCIRHGVAV